ncbi:hypothetical protein FB451DRAFT_1406390 [Mycena latifolia]|nr:hypothetical protein FB451DRAFT_1406390 [Mycena latifolia]
MTVAVTPSASYAAKIPPHLVFFCTVLGVPIYTVPHIWAALVLQRIRARASGTRLVPIVPGRWPASLDILADLRWNWNVSYPLEVLRELSVASHTNTVNLRIGWDDYIFTKESEYIRIILATDFSNYVKSGVALRESMGSVLGPGVFNSDGTARPLYLLPTAGHVWKFHRAATCPFFTRDRISDFEIFAYLAECARLTIILPSSSAPVSTAPPRHSPAPPPSPSSPVLRSPLSRTVTSSRPLTPPPFTTSPRVAWWGRSSSSLATWRAPMRVVDAYLAPIMRAAVRQGWAPVKASEPETLLDDLLNLTPEGSRRRDVHHICILPSIPLVSSHPNPSLPGSISSSAHLNPHLESVRATTWPSSDPVMMYRRTELWGGPTAEADRFLDECLKAHVLANPYCFLPSTRARMCSAGGPLFITPASATDRSGAVSITPTPDGGAFIVPDEDRVWTVGEASGRACPGTRQQQQYGASPDL